MDEVGAGALASTEHQAPRPAFEGTMEVQTLNGESQGDAAARNTALMLGASKINLKQSGSAMDPARSTAAADRRYSVSQ